MAPRPAPPPLLQRPPGLFSWLGGRAPGNAGGPAARPTSLEMPFPVATFCFDGFPRSAARMGAALLENVGGLGTFYASTAGAGAESLMGPMFGADDLVRLSSAGHEIGCATHRQLDCRNIAADAFLADLVVNGDVLGAMGYDGRLEAFAYPSGRVGRAAKGALPQRYLSGRGMSPGLTSGAADLACLRANAMYGFGALQRCLALIERARRGNGWVIFFAYDVATRPSPWGVPTGLLERLCGAAYASGLRILTVSATVKLAARMRGEPGKTTP